MVWNVFLSAFFVFLRDLLMGTLAFTGLPSKIVESCYEK